MQVKKSFTFSFSKRNNDVFQNLQKKYKDDDMLITDYFNEASRFYEKYKDKISELENNQVNNKNVENAIIDCLVNKDSKVSPILKGIIAENINSVLLTQIGLGLSVSNSKRTRSSSKRTESSPKPAEPKKLVTSKLKPKVTSSSFESD